MVIGVGLFFQKEWARKGWLIFLIFTLLVHFHMTIMQVLAGYSLGKTLRMDRDGCFDLCNLLGIPIEAVYKSALPLS